MSDPDADFPIKEEVEDYAGRARQFVITYYRSLLGFTVTAAEETKDGLGYEFSAFSPTSPYHALGSVRRKMYRALATRHLTWSEGSPRALHDMIRGRITARRGGQLLLVVDGRPLTLDEFGRILATHEGFQFEVKIIDSTEDRDS